MKLIVLFTFIFCTSSPIFCAPQDINIVLRSMTFKSAGEKILDTFIRTHPNVITADKIIMEIMDKEDIKTHDELYIRLGKNPDLLTKYDS